MMPDMKTVDNRYTYSLHDCEELEDEYEDDYEDESEDEDDYEDESEDENEDESDYEDWENEFEEAENRTQLSLDSRRRVYDMVSKNPTEKNEYGRLKSKYNILKQRSYSNYALQQTLPTTLLC